MAPIYKIALKRYLGLVCVITMGLLSILGSGGGGGGGNGGSEPLIYSGNTNAAIITSSNAGILVNNIMGWSEISGIISISSVVASAPSSNIGLVNLANRLRSSVHIAIEKRPGIPQNDSTITAIQVNESYPCTNGGSTHITGNLNDDGTGILNIDFDNCQEDSDTIDGEVSFRVDAFDTVYLEPTDATMSFSRITISSPKFSFTLGGSVRTELIFVSDIERTTINMTIKDNSSGSMLKAENLVIVVTYDDIFSPTSYSMTQAGRVFDSVHGYVDVTTSEVLLYSNLLIEYPDQGGQLLLTGAGDSKAKMIAASTEKVRIEIDAEGNDNFDEFKVYYWTDIGGTTAPNEPPDVSSIVIQPDNPYTTDSLSANVALVTDPDADSLNYSYVWRKNGIVLVDQTSASLPADQYIKKDVIEVEVIVSDGTLSVSKTDSVTILNSPPVVDAGTDITFTFGDAPSLEGNASDADNDSLTYHWSIVSQPFDGNATLSDTSALDPNFTYEGQGVYTFQLVVSDDENQSNDTVAITLEPMPLFSPYASVDIPSQTEALAIGDVNGDGLEDVVVTTSYNSDPENDTHLFVLLQDQYGNLGEPVKYSVGLQPTLYQVESIAIADMNDDSMDDVVTSYENGVGVMLQNTQGTLDPITVYASNHASFSNTYKVVAADFNGDGLNDIASIDWGTQSEDVDVFLQSNTGSLNLPVSYTAPHNGWDDLAFGDVDGDGLNDIVVMSGQSYAYDNLSVLIQQANHTFGSAVPYDLGGDVNSNAVGVGDVNGDNLDDVVLAYGGNKPSSNIAIFYQNTGGTLDTPISFLSYDSPTAVEIADINGDGKKDIVIGHSGWNAIGVYLQKPDGALMGEQRYPFTYSTNNPHRMAIEDINADGQNDIVDASGSGITILYHN